MPKGTEVKTNEEQKTVTTDPFEMDREELQKQFDEGKDGLMAELYQAATEGIFEDDDDESEAVEPAKADNAKSEPAKGDNTGDNDLQARLAALEKQVAEKDKFIERQAQEVGMTRKEMAAFEASGALPELDRDTLVDLFAENPEEAVDRILAQREKKREVQAQKLEEVRRSNQEVITAYVPEHEELLSEVFDMVRDEDKADDKAVKDLEETFWTMPAVLSLNLLKRAGQRKALREANERIARLEEEVKTGKKGRRDVIDGIEQAIKGKRPAAGVANLPAAPVQSDDAPDMWNMSREELADWRKRNRALARETFKFLEDE